MEVVSRSSLRILKSQNITGSLPNNMLLSIVMQRGCLGATNNYKRELYCSYHTTSIETLKLFFLIRGALQEKNNDRNEGGRLYYFYKFENI